MRTVFLLLLALAPAAPTLRAQSPPPEFVQIDRQPEKISGDNPAYPDSLRQAGIEGRVVVRAWIGKDGRVKEVQVLRSDHDGFNRNTVEAVRSWRFRPAEKDGQPVEVWMTIPVRFRQDSPPPPRASDTSRPGLLRGLSQILEPVLSMASPAACGPLQPVVVRFDHPEQLFPSELSHAAKFRYSVCLLNGETGVAKRVDGDTLGSERSTEVLRVAAESALMLTITDTASPATCSALPKLAMDVEDGRFTLGGNRPDASHMPYISCLQRGINRFDRSGMSDGTMVTGEQMTEMLQTIFVSYAAKLMQADQP